MLERFLRTGDDRTLLIIRVTVGVIILAHGLQEVFGWFGGHGPARTIADFETWFQIPPPVTVLVILAESVGALCVVLGLATRFMAASIGMVMAGAIALVVGKWGFFMNWYSQPRGEGYEFHLLVLGMVLALVLGGGGRWSLDRWLLQRIRSGSGPRPAYAV